MVLCVLVFSFLLFGWHATLQLFHRNPIAHTSNERTRASPRTHGCYCFVSVYMARSANLQLSDASRDFFRYDFSVIAIPLLGRVM